VPITLYELAAADPKLVFSPYCWRIRFALAHKDLPAKRIAWRFTETNRIAFSNQGKVPVLVDGRTVVHDSWAIAHYLETTYPNRPALLPNGDANARFINAWADTILHGALTPLIMADIHDLLHVKDQAYFRSTREARFGRKLEDFRPEQAMHREALHRTLTPLRWTLRSQEWIGGEHPDYTDYIVAGALQWARCTSRAVVLEQDDPVFAWFTRVLALFDGLGANAVTV